MGPLFRFDMDGYRWIHVASRTTLLDPLMRALSFTGDGAFQVVVILGLLLFRGARSLFWVLAAAFVFNGLTRILLMQAIQRSRPSNLMFSTPLEGIYGDSSFPSGHTSTSFAVASMLLLVLWGGNYAWIGWAAIAWAACVGYSRVYLGVHWPTDVIGGAVYGFGSSCAVFLVLRRTTNLFPGNEVAA